MNTTNAFLPHFRARRAGTLVNFSSQVTALAMPAMGIYTASKAAVDALSDTWAHELAEYGIRSVSVKVRESIKPEAQLPLPAPCMLIDWRT